MSQRNRVDVAIALAFVVAVAGVTALSVMFSPAEDEPQEFCEVIDSGLPAGWHRLEKRDRAVLEGAFNAGTAIWVPLPSLECYPVDDPTKVTTRFERWWRFTNQ